MFDPDLDVNACSIIDASTTLDSREELVVTMRRQEEQGKFCHCSCT